VLQIIITFVQLKVFDAALALLLVAKVTKTAGVAIPPHPTNAAQCVECCVCYKSRKFETSFARQISVRFSQKYFNLLKPLKYFCSPQTPPFVFGAKPRTPFFSLNYNFHSLSLI
ncbi:MAG: hypothetical protein IJ362_07025, partial [Oscillospiraceae bacterium]|nr:hypothetical protein [Oscillospiraceae bacterium]